MIGLDHIVSRESKQTHKGGQGWFNVVICDACGHVYGVFAKRVLTAPMG